MTKSHLAVGKKGEDVAAAHLLQEGYEVVARNVRTSAGEIDLIVRKDELIVFVEVKAKSRDDGIAPTDRIDRAKLERIHRAAEVWIEGQLKRGADEFPARIDVIGVCEGRVVEHFQDVEF